MRPASLWLVSLCVLSHVSETERKAPFCLGRAFRASVQSTDKLCASHDAREHLQRCV
jgi:hypothetical protein